jgi:hypothetical protein
MSSKKMDWTPDLTLPIGKGATVQRFTSNEGKDSLEIETTPWGEGDLKINGEKFAHVGDEISDGDAFRDLEKTAEYLESKKDTDDGATSSSSDSAKAPKP